MIQSLDADKRRTVSVEVEVERIWTLGWSHSKRKYIEDVDGISATAIRYCTALQEPCNVLESITPLRGQRGLDRKTEEDERHLA